MQGELQIIMIQISVMELFIQRGNSSEGLYYDKALLFFADHTRVVMIIIMTAMILCIILSKGCRMWLIYPEAQIAVARSS